ncbi:MAG: hypothetical protein AABW59_00550 [archaeon]
MDMLTFLISITLLAVVIQIGEFWMVMGATMILVVAAKDVKMGMFLIFSVVLLYFINGMGMRDYWMFAALGLLVLGYLLGLGKEEAPVDPYAGLLGGAGMGMG